MIRAASILLFALSLACAAPAQPSSDAVDAFTLGLAASERPVPATRPPLLSPQVWPSRPPASISPRSELRAVSWHRRWRPKVDFFGSISARGYAFPAIGSQGYDPAHAAIAQWPGDTWGVTISWSLDQLLDRQPLHRARADVRDRRGPHHTGHRPPRAAANGHTRTPDRRAQAPRRRATTQPLS